MSGTCVYGPHNQMLCCRAGMIAAVLDVLATGQKIDKQASGW